jgi:acetyl-CoA C-acetyltransferase/acetyl-CoA acyltransferase
VGAVELGRAAVREARAREIDAEALDEVIVGNIAGPADAANIASDRARSEDPRKSRRSRSAAIALRGSRASSTPLTASFGRRRSRRRRRGRVDVADSVPVFRRGADIWTSARARNLASRVAAFAIPPASFPARRRARARLTDSVSGLNMGQTAKVLASSGSLAKTRTPCDAEP